MIAGMLSLQGTPSLQAFLGRKWACSWLAKHIVKHIRTLCMNTITDKLESEGWTCGLEGCVHVRSVKYNKWREITVKRYLVRQSTSRMYTYIGRALVARLGGLAPARPIKPPTTVLELRRFMGVVKQVGKFSLNLAELTQSLRKLLRVKTVPGSEDQIKNEPSHRWKKKSPSPLPPHSMTLR